MNWFTRQPLKKQLGLVLGIALLGPLLAVGHNLWWEQRAADEFLKERSGHLELLLDEAAQIIEPLLAQELPARELMTVVAPAMESLLERQPGIIMGLYLVRDDLTLEFSSLYPRRPAVEQRLAPGAGVLGRADGHSAGEGTELLLSKEILPGKEGATIWIAQWLPAVYAGRRSSHLVAGVALFASVILGLVGVLALLRNQVKGVETLKSGLARLEQDLNTEISAPPGELGEIASAINKMALTLREKKALEEELRRSERLVSLGHMVAGVAHELRNPLAIMRGTVQLLEEETATTPSAEEYLEIIKEQVDRQNLVVKELLDFASPKKVVRQPLDINRLIQGVLTFTASHLRQNKIQLSTSLADNLPLVEGDGEQLKQVLVNLIINAVEAMAGGGKLFVKTKVEEEQVVISVADTGGGISEAELEHIFDPFYTTRPEGTGLGLAISHSLVKSHGGRISARSTLGQGSVFTVYLPSQKGEEGENAPDSGD